MWRNPWNLTVKKLQVRVSFYLFKRYLKELTERKKLDGLPTAIDFLLCNRSNRNILAFDLKYALWYDNISKTPPKRNQPNRMTFTTPSPFPPSCLQYLVVMTTPHSRCWVLLQMAAVDGKSVTQQGDEATGRCDGVTAWQCRLQHRCATRKPCLCTHGTPLPGNSWEILSSSALWSWSDVKTGRSPFRHANAPIITHVKVLCFRCEWPSWRITLKSIWRKGFGAKVKLRSPDGTQCVWSAVFQNKIPRA